MSRRARTFLALLTAVMLGAPAFAGPLLVCHPYDIGAAKSLPWNENDVWNDTRPNYELSHLVVDTEALLTPATPVVVRMETLRRAAIYASHDRAIAMQLLDHLNARVERSRQNGRADALALLDAGYTRATFRQIALLVYDRAFRIRAANVTNLPGLDEAPSMLQDAVAQHPDNPGLQFAGALVASIRRDAGYDQYAHGARVAAHLDDLVERNLALLR